MQMGAHLLLYILIGRLRDLAVCSHSTHQLFCPLFQKWRSARSSARRVGDSAFLLLAFLSACFAKEKRLKSLGI
jgi:hypothetical protein